MWVHKIEAGDRPDNLDLAIQIEGPERVVRVDRRGHQHETEQGSGTVLH
jgi:hypothetical protein